MKKGFISLLLIFALLFSFTACQKLEESEEYKVETDVYVVDEEGESHILITNVNDEGETEQYYIDEVNSKKVTIPAENATNKEGEKVTTQELKTVVEKKVVEKSTKKSKKELREEEELISILGGGDLEKMSEQLITNVTEPTTILPDVTINEKAVTTVVEKTNASGGGAAREVYESKLETLSKYSQTIVISSPDSENVKIDFATDGSQVYASMLFPATDEGYMEIQAKVLKSGSGYKTYLVVPSLKIYCEMPEDMQDEFKLDLLDSSQKSGTYVSTTEQKIGADTYKIETYTLSDGTKAEYYYNSSSELISMKIIDGSTTVTKIDYGTRSGNVKDSYFKLQDGFVDLSKYLDADGDIEDIISEAQKSTTAATTKANG